MDPTWSEAQKQLWERARKGVLKFVASKGGQAPFPEVHDYSEKTFFIGHRRFSMMMDSFLDDSLVELDHESGTITLLDAGKTYAES